LDPGVFVGDELGVVDEAGTVAEGLGVFVHGEVVVREFPGLVPIAGKAEGTDDKGVQEVFKPWQGMEMCVGLLAQGIDVQDVIGRYGDVVLLDEVAADVVGDGFPGEPVTAPELAVHPEEVFRGDGTEVLAGVFAHGHEVIGHQDAIVTGAEVGGAGFFVMAGGIRGRGAPEAFTGLFGGGAGPDGGHGVGEF